MLSERPAHAASRIEAWPGGRRWSRWLTVRRNARTCSRLSSRDAVIGSARCRDRAGFAGLGPLGKPRPDRVLGRRSFDREVENGQIVEEPRRDVGRSATADPDADLAVIGAEDLAVRREVDPL